MALRGKRKCFEQEEYTGEGGVKVDRMKEGRSCGDWWHVRDAGLEMPTSRTK